LLATSDSGCLSVLRIDVTRRRLQCIEQVCLPRPTSFHQLWSGQTEDHSGSARRAYGHYLRAHPSGIAVAVASLDNKIAVVPVRRDTRRDGIFELDEAGEARVIGCADVACTFGTSTSRIVRGAVTDVAFVSIPRRAKVSRAAFDTCPVTCIYM
jgi:hypothetical protein